MFSLISLILVPPWITAPPRALEPSAVLEQLKSQIAWADSLPEVGHDKRFTADVVLKPTGIGSSWICERQTFTIGSPTVGHLTLHTLYRPIGPEPPPLHLGSPRLPEPDCAKLGSAGWIEFTGEVGPDDAFYDIHRAQEQIGKAKPSVKPTCDEPGVDCLTIARKLLATSPETIHGVLKQGVGTRSTVLQFEERRDLTIVSARGVITRIRVMLRPPPLF